ncbi:SUMO-activating enzyme subunit 2-like [Ptychodera flava]|uniref:SUMO-activating enzyme subunit 2-like n=1 Tax=Ptychodera flava TaxID=63121 RepID=UPI00396A9C28
MSDANMAAGVNEVLSKELSDNVSDSKVLVVGAGGIGCELIKNLVLTGFKCIHLIDLDTIDVSNLNRQFLFQKKHVGKSKAQVARESALRFNPDADIYAYHDNIMKPEYGTEFFKQFTIVMNALDNRAARNHVNRMCLAANRPLIESGTAGYLGQVTVIKKQVTECYECQPKAPQKTYQSCTIRNTPSEPIHCIVWAKHLFNQLFGEEDPDQDVSPDTADPEAAGDAGMAALESEADENVVGGIQRVSTRGWAESTGYDAIKIFQKLFHDDIKYLLSMDKLWKKRRPPNPINWNNVHNIPLTPEQSQAPNTSAGQMKDQRVWSMQECADVFKESIGKLKEQYKEKGELVWDKDDKASMDFVTSTANIRAHIFGIATKSRFDVKSMAGNIIPAIATTNAIIAGLIVVEALKILSGNLDKCKTIYLSRVPNARKKLLYPCSLLEPNPKCYVCAPKPEVSVKLNTKQITVKDLEEKILKTALGMVAPDVEIDDGKGTILISSEEGETEENNEKNLSVFSIVNGSRLKADDFLQNYELVLNIIHTDEKLEDDKEFEIVGESPDLPKPSEDEKMNTANQENDEVQPGPSAAGDVNAEDDLVVVEEVEEEMETAATSRKRRQSEEGPATPVAKKRRFHKPQDEDDLIICD